MQSVASHKERKLIRQASIYAFILGAIAGGAFDTLLGLMIQQTPVSAIGVAAAIAVLLVAFLASCYLAYWVSARTGSTRTLYEIRFPAKTLQALVTGAIDRCKEESSLAKALRELEAWMTSSSMFRNAKLGELRSHTESLIRSQGDSADTVVQANLRKLCEYPSSLSACSESIISRMEASKVFSELGWTVEAFKDGVRVRGPKSRGYAPSYVEITVRPNKPLKVSAPALCQVTFQPSLPDQEYEVALLALTNLFTEVFGGEEMGLKPVLPDEEKYWERVQVDVTRPILKELDTVQSQIPRDDSIKAALREVIGKTRRRQVHD